MHTPRAQRTRHAARAPRETQRVRTQCTPTPRGAGARLGLYLVVVERLLLEACDLGEDLVGVEEAELLGDLVLQHRGDARVHLVVRSQHLLHGLEGRRVARDQVLELVERRLHGLGDRG